MEVDSVGIIAIVSMSYITTRIVKTETSVAIHVGKFGRADDRPKLAMLAANVDYRYWTDDR